MPNALRRSASVMMLSAAVFVVVGVQNASAADTPVSVSNSSSQECPPVERTEAGVKGGCVAELYSDAVTWGHELLGYIQECSEYSTLRVDSSGHGWISNVWRSPGDYICEGGSGLVCYDEVNAPAWEVQLYGNGDGSFRADVDYCSHTFLGTAEGALSLQVNDHPWGGQFLVAEETTPIGTDGFWLYGTWDGLDLEIEEDS